MTRRSVRFRLASEKVLEKTAVEETEWTDQPTFDEAWKRAFKRGCKLGTRKTVQRVSLP